MNEPAQERYRDVVRAAQALTSSEASALCAAYPGANIIVGTDGDDLLDGTNKADCIVAGRGNDRVRAGNGNDIVFAGDGADAVYGDNGNDLLSLGTGNDRGEGGNGDDELRGADGADTLDGQNGNDRLYGEDCHDRIVASNDLITSVAPVNTGTGVPTLTLTRSPQDGRLTATTLGVVTTSVENDLNTTTPGYGELTALGAKVSGSDVFRQQYQRDVLGRIQRIDETIQGSTSTRQYEYDAAGRLARVRDGAGVLLSEYDYDGNGARTRVRTASQQVQQLGCRSVVDGRPNSLHAARAGVYTPPVAAPDLHLSPRTIELMELATKHFAPEFEPGTLAELWHQPASRNVRGDTSRQARHARASRLRSGAVASVVLLACEMPECTELLVDPEFARLRPLTAPVHTRCIHLASTAAGQQLLTPHAAERTLERLLPQLVATGARWSTASVDEAAILHSVLRGIATGLMLHGPKLRDAYRELLRAARSHGLFDCMHLRMQFAVGGSYVGESGDLIDLLLNTRVREFDLVDTLLYVHAGSGPTEQRAITRYLRGEHVHPAHVLPPARARAAWQRLADFVRATMRYDHHFTSEGSILMTLSWVDELARYARELQLAGAAPVASDVEVLRLLAALRKIDSVEALEKGRFWRVFERLPEGVLRSRLLELWSLAPERAS